MHLKAFLWNEEVRRVICSSLLGSFMRVGFDSDLREKLAGGVAPVVS